MKEEIIIEKLAADALKSVVGGDDSGGAVETMADMRSIASAWE